MSLPPVFWLIVAGVVAVGIYGAIQKHKDK